MSDIEIANHLEFRQYPISITNNTAKGQAQPHKKKRLTIAAGGMIFAHNKILLDRSDNIDLWSVPGGTVNFNESLQETVVRELKEELNLNVEILSTPPFLFNFEVEDDDYIDIIILIHFIVKVTDKNKIIMGNEIIDYKWESIGSSFRDCYPNVKPAVDHYMKI